MDKVATVLEISKLISDLSPEDATNAVAELIDMNNGHDGIDELTQDQVSLAATYFVISCLANVKKLEAEKKSDVKSNE